MGPHPEPHEARVEGRMMDKLLRRALSALLVGVLVPWSVARAAPAAPWPDTFVVRIEALALMQTLTAESLASRSATFTLEKWCGAHRLAGAAEPKIVARLVPGDDKAATPEQRQRLEVAPGGAVKFGRS